MTLKTVSFLYSHGLPIMVCPWILIKTDAVLFGTYQSAKTLSNISNINEAGTSVALSDTLKLLGVTLDRHLTLDSHTVQVIVPRAFTHEIALPHQERYFQWYGEVGGTSASEFSPGFDLMQSIEAKHYKTSESTKYTGSSGDALQSLQQRYHPTS